MTSLPAAGLAVVIALAAAGLAWQECLLLVTAAFAAQRLELWRLQRAPLDAWRFGARCLVAGGAGLLGAAALGVVLVASPADWWQPNHNPPLRTLGMIAGAGVFVSALQRGIKPCVAEAGLWTLSVLGASLGTFAAAAGHCTLHCWISGAGAVQLGWASWQTAVAGASALRAMDA